MPERNPGHRRWQLGATRLVVLTVLAAVVVTAVGSIALGSLLVHADGHAAFAGMSVAWRDVIVTCCVGAIALLVVCPPLVRRLAEEKGARAQAQRAVLEAKAFSDAVVDGMDAGVLTLDARTGTLTLNRVAREMYGVDEVTDPEELRERIWAAHRDPQSGQPIPAPRLPLARALRGSSCEMWFELRPLDDGPAVQVDVRARPIRDEVGRVVAAAAVVHDMTELVVRERRLAEHAEHIEALGAATRAILREEDARLAVCDAAQSVSGAAFVSLFEPDGGGGLVCRASSGLELDGMRMALSGRSHVSASFNSARTCHVANVATDPGVDHDAVDKLEEMLGGGIEAATYTPVVVGGRSIAVLIATFAAGHPAPERVVPTLEVLAAEAGVAIEREDLLRRLSAQAVTDPLTGLGNRRAWFDGFARETARAARTSEPLGVVMLDIDHFKLYNDANGHPAGDDLLAQVAALWKGRLRGGDVICRVGGEEFGILLPGCPPESIFDIVEDLRRLVPGGQTASAGTTFWGNGEQVTATVDRVDRLLYEAKEKGRNRQVFRKGPEIVLADSFTEEARARIVDQRRRA